MSEPYPYVDCEHCDGGQIDCYCGNNCCSGYAACEYCDGNAMVCSRCGYNICECPEPSPLEKLAQQAK
jgi:hypothetical protein